MTLLLNMEELKMSKSYTVIRKRAYWVREVMHVDAATPEDAEDAFFNEFDVELVIEDVVSYPEGEVEVIENE